MTQWADRYVSELSGGMQKRAMLARTLIYDPKTIQMDEPFGPLDAQLKLALQAELLARGSKARESHGSQGPREQR